jgi:GAF domain
MKSRAFRFALHVLFVGIVAAAAYVVWKKESEGTAAAGAARAFAERAHAASRALLEIKGAHPGYVAAGQGEDYWIAKVDALIGSVRESLVTLRSAAQSANARAELGVAEEALDDFESMDRRARDYARNGQRLLASDLVFSDGIEKMDAAVAAVERARRTEAETTLAAANIGRRDALMATAGAAAIGLLLMFLLVPLPHAPAAVPVAVAVEAPRRPAAAESPARKASPGPPPAVVQTRPPAPPAPIVATKPAGPALDLPEMAALCSDLARAVDTRALPPALERAARLLDASGVVIWIADPDGRELMPVMAHGYPQNLVSRLGTIARDAENVTAAAFRTGLVQTVKADAISHGAIAAPLLTPAGPVGVMAAEVLNDGERRESTRAAAVIVAAQLATLLGPPLARNHGKTEAV